MQMFSKNGVYFAIFCLVYSFDAICCVSKQEKAQLK